MNDDEILALQRALRRRFFEGPQAVRWRPGRELVAQLLLYLDSPERCWALVAKWLRETLDADRVDCYATGSSMLHGSVSAACRTNLALGGYSFYRGHFGIDEPKARKSR